MSFFYSVQESQGMIEEQHSSARSKTAPKRKKQISDASMACLFMDKSIQLLGKSVATVLMHLNRIDMCNAGRGSEWLRQDTLDFFCRNNQCQTLAVLGGMMVSLWEEDTGDLQVRSSSWLSGFALYISMLLLIPDCRYSIRLMPRETKVSIRW